MLTNNKINNIQRNPNSINSQLNLLFLIYFIKYYYKVCFQGNVLCYQQFIFSSVPFNIFSLPYLKYNRYYLSYLIKYSQPLPLKDY